MVYARPSFLVASWASSIVIRARVTVAGDAAAEAAADADAVGAADGPLGPSHPPTDSVAQTAKISSFRTGLIGPGYANASSIGASELARYESGAGRRQGARRLSVPR